MSVTYTEETISNDPVRDEVFVPRYARTGRARGKGGVRAWMILLPVGALALAGGAAAVWMSGETGERPLVAEEVAAPMLQATPPLEGSTPLETPAATLAPATPVAPAPVIRETAPTPPAAVQRRRPAQTRVEPVQSAPVVQDTPAEPAGPQPYTAILNAEAPSAPAPAPAITPAPLN